MKGSIAGPASLTNSLQVRGDDEFEAGHGMWKVVLPDPSNSHHLQRYVDGLAVSGGGGRIGYKMKDRGQGTRDRSKERVGGIYVMRMLIMLGKSTLSGCSMMWPRNSPSRLSHLVGRGQGEVRV